ncbi:hypothetical protein [Spirosoma oryzicola]|uniref:hypothetical protein n=1 Tax=Spirosoma oryzicola TaxID=2898794 RepID=UPI001E2B945F|nr:hypothetical protein [Spirosoma oryzicola]UHG89449.1 hypothetical protein LQ777_14465 [Spirosoma oryzicola]
MIAIFYAPLKRVVRCAVTNFCLLVWLTLPSSGLPITKKPMEPRPTQSKPRPTPVNLFTHPTYLPIVGQSSLSPADNDPIRFSLRANTQSIRLGEAIDLTIKAELLTVSPTLAFHLPGATGYKLKLLLPDGFEQTGGDIIDYIGAELSYPNQTEITYHVIGHFSTVATGTSFRLLRGHSQAGAQSLFVEKAVITLKERPTEKRALREAETVSAETTLYVPTENALKSARVGTPNYRSYLEFATCESIGGWAIDLADVKQSIDLAIYVNDTKVATVKADERRTDVAQAFDITDSYQYGFRWTIPDQYKGNKPLHISVRYAGDNTELTHSPLSTPVCYGSAQPTETVSGPAESPANANYRGFLESANCDAIGGWTMNTTAPRQTVRLDVYINDTKVTTIKADENRTDVAQAYSVTGFDLYGYHWIIPDKYKQNAPLKISVKAAGSTFELSQSPVLLTTCPGSTSANAPTPSTPPTDPAPVTPVVPIEPAKCAFTLSTTSTNTSCSSAVSLSASCSGANCDQVSYTWSGNGVRQQGQTINLTAPATNGVYAYTVTASATGCDSKTAVASLTVEGCPTPAPTDCDLMLSASSINTSCGSAVSLSATCSGAACDQASYAWNGNGITGQGKTLNLTAPSTNGTYSYSVTASVNGCSRIAVATITVDGCTPPPTLSSNEQYPILDSPQPEDKRPVLQNDRVRVAIDLGVGGVVREVTDLQVGENMINCYVKSNGKRDAGRDDQISLYSLPDANTKWTINGKQILDDIGYNPVQGGNIAGEYSPILGYGRTDKILYSKTRGLHWGLRNEPGDYVVEQWIRLEGNIVRRHVRITGDRRDQTKYADSRQQELPCTYTSSAFYQYYVVQGEPYSNAPLVNVNAIPNIGGSGKSFNQYNYSGHMGPYDVNASEPWIVAVRSNTNRGIALHTPYSHEFKAGLFDSPGVGAPESVNAGYISNGMNLILDPNGVYEFDVNMVVGTLDEIRSTINTLPRSETKPNYVFHNNPIRHGFTYRKGYDQGFPITNELIITPTDRRFRLVSPHKGYKASEFGVVYVRMRAITPETQLLFDWRKVGQSQLDAAGKPQSVTFTIIPDNQYHTYAIPVKNNELWNGIINEFSIRYTNPAESAINGQQFGVKWISATDLGDQ